ncbi:MAG: NfeD family protein [Clostridiaceae bacterium]
MTLLWVILIAIVIVLDMTTSNILYSWMSLGFVAALVVQSFGFGSSAQIMTACIVGALSFIVGSYISNKYIKTTIDPSPILIDKIIGTTHTANKIIGEETQYKINGIYWTLKNEGPDLEIGEKFRIVGIKSNKLYITKERD